jgi:hypothetical protein
MRKGVPIKFEFRNSCDICGINYSTGFTQWFWLYGQDLTKPDYNYKPDSAEDGRKDEHFLFRKSTKEYKLNVVVHEYQMDMLAILHLHDEIYVTDAQGHTEKVKSIEIGSPSWKTEILCEVEMTLIFDSFNFSSGNCCSSVISKCDPVDFEIVYADYSFPFVNISADIPDNTASDIYLSNDSGAIWHKINSLPLLSGEIGNINQIDITGILPDDTYTVRISCYNNTCDYGYTPAQTMT